MLLEPEIEYDDLIQVMDAIRSAELPADSELRRAQRPASADRAARTARGREGRSAQDVRVALFTDIAVGDAP